MSEISDKVQAAVSFLTPTEIQGLLEGTLEALEIQHPGYTDHLILGVLSLRAGIPTGEGNEN